MINECTEEMSYDAVGATAQAVEAKQESNALWSMAISVKSLLVDPGTAIVALTPAQIQEDQKADVHIGPVLKYKLSGVKPSREELKKFSTQSLCLIRGWEKLETDENGVLWRRTVHRKQLVLPDKHRITVLKELHDQMGHQGTDRTVSLIRDRFFWPYMQQGIKQYAMTCACLKQKKPSRETRAPLTNIITTQPFQLVSVDFLHLDRCKGGYEYIIVVVDHFTRFAQAYPTTSKSGKVVADKIFNDYALKFGFPARIHHDQGGEFENQLFSQLSKYCNVAGSRTTPYHPQGNGQVERFNRTLMQMLKTLTDMDKLSWKDSLNKLIFVYNCTRTEVTGFSPFYLLFGRSPRLPIDLMCNLPTEAGSLSHHRYAEQWRQGMQEAYAIAQENAKKSGQRNKRIYDGKVRSSVLYPGDRVLVRNMTPRGGPGKLRNHWEDAIHTVVRQVGEDLPIYELRPEHGKGKSRILHRNLLLPCDHLPLETEVHLPAKPKKKTSATDKVREGSEDEEDEDDYFRGMPYQPVTLPPEPVGGMPEIVQRVIPPDLSTPTAEPPHLENSVNDNPLENLDIRDENTPHTEEDRASPPMLHVGQEDEIDMRPQRPQRLRKPPKTFRYDKIGTPSCYHLTAVPSYVRPHVWAQPVQSCYNQLLYFYGT